MSFPDGPVRQIPCTAAKAEVGAKAGKNTPEAGHVHVMPCLRRRGGNGERCYGACAHGVAQSHCRILYHISRGEVRTKSSPCAKSRGAHLHPPHPVSMYNNAYIERSDSFVPKCTDSSTSIYHSQHIEFDYRNTIYQSGLH